MAKQKKLKGPKKNQPTDIMITLKKVQKKVHIVA